MTILTGSTVINCVDGTLSSGTPMLVPVYDATGRVVAMSQVTDNFPPSPISADILRGRQGDAPASGRTCRQHWKTVRLRTTQGEVSKGLMKRVVTLRGKAPLRQ